MYYVNRSFRDLKQKQRFVALCESNFEFRLSQLVHNIIYEDSPEVVTLSGPTCSGKTTTARKLTEEIKTAGKNAVVLSIDDFFRERTELRQIGEVPDFDTVAAIDLDLLAHCLSAMIREERIILPKYDFHTGRRTFCREYISTPNDIIILEGIQAVYPEVTALLKFYPYKSIFINVTDDIMVNGTIFSKTDIRLARRLVRDYRFRNASPEFTMEIWQNVRENEEKNIFPYMMNSDYILNSLQPYEVFMLGQFVLPLIEMIPLDVPYVKDAKELAEKFKAVRGWDIPPECLSEFSIYHEFLG